MSFGAWAKRISILSTSKLNKTDSMRGTTAPNQFIRCAHLAEKKPQPHTHTHTHIRNKNKENTNEQNIKSDEIK